MRQMFIAGRRIADDEPPFVIAEVGHNHQGDIQKAKALFRAAHEAGCDAVKLQKRDNGTLFTQAAYKAVYNSENAFGPTYGEHREALELGEAEYVALKTYAEGLGLVFFATPFDMRSAEFLADLGVPCFKVASADLLNIPLLTHLAAYGLPIILSTGGGTLADVQRAYEVVANKAPIAILQCTATYPVEPHEMNLRVIQTYRTAFPFEVIGLSDHQDGIGMAGPAYVLGARIFEKHFTLSHTWKGSDHAFSLEPEGMRRMVHGFQQLQAALGDGIKRPYASELPVLLKMGKALVASHALIPDAILGPADIAIKSPADGLPPYEFDNLLGKRLLRALREDEPIRWDDVTDKPAREVDFGLVE